MDLDKFFNKNKGIRRSILLWSCALVTYSVVRNHLSDIAFMGVIGLVTTAVGYYQWSRNKDDK